MHPAIHAVRQAKQKLYRLQRQERGLGMAPDEFRWVAAFKPEQVEKTLRVEISRDEMRNLLKMLYDGAVNFYPHLNGQREGPPTLEGVAYYEVAALPDPGWRVINPMEKA